MTAPTTPADGWDRIMASLDAVISKFDDLITSAQETRNV